MIVKCNYLYRTTNILTGSYYIGVHRTDRPIEDGYLGSGNALLCAIQKYGKHNFKHEIIQLFESYEECLEAEKKYLTEEILSDPKCYNLKAGGKGGAHPGNQNAKGMTYTHTEKARLNISRARMGKKWNEAVISKIKKNRSGKGTGKNNAMAKPEAVEKVRVSKLGRKRIYSPDRSEFKQILPESGQWNSLVDLGWSPLNT